MKQKKIGDILYVYSTTAYEITQDTDAAVIKIQEECIPAYAALNASLVSKFQPINYKLFCVKYPEWADYMDDYYVHIASYIGEGTATATPNSGDEGEEITLSATPATGWEFVRFRAQPLHGSVAITVKDNKFTMPADDVRVQAEFDKIDFDITVDDQIQNGSLSAPETANLGDTVTITATPASGYKLDTLTVMCGSLEITVVNNQFTMPAGDVTVTGTFVQDIDYSSLYFTVESLEDNNEIEIRVSRGRDSEIRSPFYISTDNGSNWVESHITSGVVYLSCSATLNTGDKMLIKGNDPYEFMPQTNSHGIVYSTKTYKVYGNIMSLLYGDNFDDKYTLTGDNNFSNLLCDPNNLIDASNLILPATTLSGNCYNSMFQGCTSLTTAPSLPATTLSGNCYSSMFYGCSSLTTTPVLPATTLSQGCYNAMFQGCTSLATVPELPATTLENFCYSSMFYGCTNVDNLIMLGTNLPEDAESSYPSSISGILANCAEVGTLYVSPSLTTGQRNTLKWVLPGESGETLWTIEDYVPAS